ncbi:MAG: tetratricopeptide repeat protein [Bacillales bacterium]|jgi:tetratricopeptide (TPR) repeat protein|nr:tetratricopeptide repeat protein [Bacillales bacterium]
MNLEIIRKCVNDGDLNELQAAVGMILANEDSNEIFAAAEELSGYGYLEEAQTLYEELRDRHPEEKILYVNLAEILIELSQEEEALNLLENVNEGDELYPSALILMADCYESLGLTEVSEEKVLKAKSILPEDPVTTFALAEIYFIHGNIQMALELYTTLKLESINGVSIATRIANCLVSLGKFEESLVYFENAEKSIKEINLHLEYGLAAYSAENYDLATRQFKKLLDLDKEYQSAYLYLSKSYEKLENIDLAIQTAIKGLELDEYHKELRLYLAQLYILKNDLEQSIKILQETIAIDPAYFEASLTLAKLYIQKEEYERAIDLIIEIQKNSEEDPQFNWILASSYNGIEDYKMASKYFEEANNVFSENIEFLEEYAEFLIEEGKRDEARNVILKLLEIDPSNEEYQEALDRI